MTRHVLAGPAARRGPALRVLVACIAVAVLLAVPNRRASAEESPPDPHAVQPERPTVATHAHTVAPGWIEIESGLERDRISADASAWSTPTVAKIGVSRRTQLNIAGAWQRLAAGAQTASGATDASLGLKFRLLDGAPVLGDFALLPAIKFPTGSESQGTGTGTTDLSLLVISSHAFGPLALDVNAGWTRRGGDGTSVPRDATLWTVSSGFPLRGMLGAVAEVFGLPGTAGAAGSPPTAAILCGPTLQPRPWLALDLGVIAPLFGPQPHALYGGLVWNVGRLGGAPARR